MKSFEWTQARNVAQAAHAATATVAAAMTSQRGKPSTDAAVIKAGGIDLLDLMKEGLLTPRQVVNMREVPGLDQIEQDNGGLRIGSKVTLAQLAADAQVRAHYRALADAAGASASPQIRHVATIGGNLLQRPRCWYFRSRAHHCARKGGYTCFAFAGENQYHAIFDHNGCAIVHPSTSATALVALDASVELTDKTGAKRVVKLEDFFVLPEADIQRENTLKPGEIVTGVLLPPQPETARSLHIKHGEMESFDWPIADVAVVLDMANGVCRKAAVVLGAAAPVSHRAKAAEAALTSKKIDKTAARAAAQAALQGARPLTMNGYKLPLFEALVRRAVLGAAQA
ncbi:MAG: FAD binding domain-containing protein [Pseudolabrys sp.]